MESSREKIVNRIVGILKSHPVTITSVSISTNQSRILPVILLDAKDENKNPMHFPINSGVTLEELKDNKIDINEVIATVNASL